MIKNYFTIALRNLARHKLLAGINIFGLSVGIACFTLFLLYAVNEFNFDRFHSNSANIFRVYRWSAAMNGDPARGDVHMPMPLGPAMKQDLPDVKNYVRLQYPWGENFARLNDEVVRLKVSYADPQIFTVFDFKFKHGNPSSCLDGLNNIVVTAAKAKALFGNENAVGKIVDIKIDTAFQRFTISGVTENIPPNSSIDFDVMGNFKFLETTGSGKQALTRWTRSSYLTFVELRPGSELPRNTAQLAAFRHKYYPEEIAEFKKAQFKWDEKSPPVRFGLQPLVDMHTDTKISGGSVDGVDPKTIWILLSIAAGVLLIAGINFTTLSIGRSAGRSREVGVRKVIGAARKQLVLQFLVEAFLLSVFSTLLGLGLVKLLLPYFNELSGRSLIFSFTLFPQMLWLLAGLTLLVGLLSGIYPALILSGFKTLDVLKNKVRIGGSNLFTRSLVTLQFALSIALIISTAIILKQVDFMSNKNPGFDKENVVMVNASETDTRKIYPVFKQALLTRPEITGIASAEIGLGGNEGFSITGFNYKDKPRNVFEYFIDPDYINVMGMQLLRGRNFDYKISTDTVTAIIVNEAMVREFGWTLDNAVGQKLAGYTETKTPVVIGVVKNFNYRSLSSEVAPQLFHQFADYSPYKFLVRIKPGNPSVALAEMENAWKSIVRDLPFKYSFLDEELDQFYGEEQRWSSIVGWAGGISIFLACLGLFGLAALAAINRTKEIGIRKVLGASLTNIIHLLSKDFLKLILTALVIAAPFSWYFMNSWLEDFAYRVNIGWLVFAATGISVLLISLLTISLQAVKAAVGNPVRSLRTE